MNPITFLVDHMMVPFLTFSYNHIFPNYGFAIILLTVVVKGLFYPLTNKQFRSMKAMQAVQPQLKELQEKFRKQPEKLQKEIMGFYKKHNINPLNGCLPILVQLPFFFAIYYTVSSATFKEMIAIPGINPGLLPFWAANLGQPDHFPFQLILPVLIGVITYLSQKFMTMDPQQAKIFAWMPVLMVVISINMPSGVLLYWVVSQALSYAQQRYINQKSDNAVTITS